MHQLRTDVATDNEQVFRLRDIFFPETDDLLGRTTSDLKLRGRIIDFSDSGNRKNQYAILEVEGINGPVVVPVEKLRSIWEDVEAIDASL